MELGINPYKIQTYNQQPALNRYQKPLELNADTVEFSSIPIKKQVSFSGFFDIFKPDPEEFLDNAAELNPNKISDKKSAKINECIKAEMHKIAAENKFDKKRIDRLKKLVGHTKVCKDPYFMENLRKVFAIPETRTPEELIDWKNKLAQNDFEIKYIDKGIIPSAVTPNMNQIEAYDFMKNVLEKSSDFDNREKSEEYSDLIYKMLDSDKSGKAESPSEINWHSILKEQIPGSIKMGRVRLEKTLYASKLNTKDIYDLDEFLTTFNKLTQIERIKDPETAPLIQLAIENLPNIFVTDENKETYKEIIARLSKIEGGWSIKDEYGGNLALRAVIAENPLLINLAFNKNVDFSEKNNFNQSAELELLKLESNPKMMEQLNNIRVKKPELVEFAKNNLASSINLALENKFVDLNTIITTKDFKNFYTLESGNVYKYVYSYVDKPITTNPWLMAARYNSTAAMKELVKHPELDKNVVDNMGDNAGILAAESGNIDVIELLNTLDDFDINYINPNTNDSVYSVAKDEATLDAIMKNPKANPNIRISDETPPPIFRTIKRAFEKKRNWFESDPDMKRFKLLCKYKNIDFSLTYNGVTITECLDSAINCFGSYNKANYADYRAYLSSVFSENYVDSVKETVARDGILSIDKIKEFVNYPNAEKIINKPLNDEKETIGFFLTDISLDRSNYKDFIEIMDKLVGRCCNFKAENSFGQSLSERINDSENEVVIEYLKNKKIL